MSAAQLRLEKLCAKSGCGAACQVAAKDARNGSVSIRHAGTWATFDPNKPEWVSTVIVWLRGRHGD